ncbi:MAG: transglycosylase SLT domain-containing protein [Nitrospiraceae bacterium]|nr:transglycosylase SLT domain-containing protein [Nitrospiraceae bacterium]
MKSRLLFSVLFLVFIIPVARAECAGAAPGIPQAGTKRNMTAGPSSPSIVADKTSDVANKTNPAKGPAAGPAEDKSAAPARGNPSFEEASKNFKLAVALMNDKKYAQSLAQFGLALKGLPFMEDYILYYESEIYSQLKDDSGSIDCLIRLLKDNPKSPLVRQSRVMVINMTIDKRLLVRLLTDFTERYPGHGDLNLQLAGLLRDEGRTAQAAEILERLYIGAGSVSKKALAELGRPPTPREQLFRAQNLLRLDEAREAEHELLSLPDDESYFKEKLDLLGRALFLQRRYNEAAYVFGLASDPFQAARAYYRASDVEDFKKAIDALSLAHDKRVAYLRLGLASIERRNGDWQDALLELKKTAADYPWAAEDAQWQTAWLYYMKKDYDDALGIFSMLARDFGDSMYHYWTARSLEAIGGEENEKAAMGIYTRLARGHDDYYAVLASAKTGIALKGPGTGPTASQDPEDMVPFRRFGVLMQAGLEKEAMGDLIYSSRKLMDPGALIQIARTLKGMGAFRSAISVAMRLPEEMQPKDVMYPKAFWQTVRKNCSHTGIDPYLVLSVMREESKFDPGACSAAGAIGLMQIEPRTAKKYFRFLSARIDGNSDGNPGIFGPSGIFDVNTNIALGSYYLDELMGEFKSIAPTLAAYNAGPQTVRKWLASGNYASVDEFVEDIPYIETKNYIKRIIATYYEYGREDGARDFSLTADGDPENRR